MAKSPHIRLFKKQNPPFPPFLFCSLLFHSLVRCENLGSSALIEGHCDINATIESFHLLFVLVSSLFLFCIFSFTLAESVVALPSVWPAYNTLCWEPLLKVFNLPFPLLEKNIISSFLCLDHSSFCSLHSAPFVSTRLQHENPAPFGLTLSHPPSHSHSSTFSLLWLRPLL